MTIPISTQADLAKIGVDVAYPLSGEYLLINDITLTGQWTPIAPAAFVNDIPILDNKFTGTFDGNGKVGIVTRLDRLERAAQTQSKMMWIILGSLFYGGGNLDFYRNLILDKT